jgi:hypothetical protein
MTTNNDSDLNALYDRVVAGLAEDVARAGTRGTHCFFCGALPTALPQVNCRCGHGADFGCGLQSRRICRFCSTAHEHVAEHLERMFACKIVSRVSSVRARLHRNLRNAAVPDSETWDTVDPKTPSQRLHFCLAQTDPYADPPEAFRAGVLKAFRRSRLLDFSSLARGLVIAKEAEMSRAALTYFMSATRQPRTLKNF